MNKVILLTAFMLSSCTDVYRVNAQLTETAIGVGVVLAKDKYDKMQVEERVGEEASRPNQIQWIQITNITVPRLSPHQKKEPDWDAPPDIYILFRKNTGKNPGELGRTPPVKGWSVDFPDGMECKFPVRLNSEATYSLEIWDYDWFGDEHIVNITQLKGEDFLGEIEEDGSGQDRRLRRLIKIKTKKIPTPPKYSEDELSEEQSLESEDKEQKSEE